MSNISLPLGLKGSGRVRYAAAMELYQAGKISPETLEIYRISSARDGQNPEVERPREAHLVLRVLVLAPAALPFRRAHQKRPRRDQREGHPRRVVHHPRQAAVAHARRVGGRAE